jgi:hypothetical protein
MTTSERATASIRPMTVDASNRDHARELWRLKAKEWVAAEDNASRLEEGRKLLLDGMIERLLVENEKLTATRAERQARTSDQYKGYLRKMHDARRLANDLAIDKVDLDRRYWEIVGNEATERTERRMSR